MRRVDTITINGVKAIKSFPVCGGYYCECNLHVCVCPQCGYWDLKADMEREVWYCHECDAAELAELKGGVEGYEGWERNRWER